LPSSDTPLGISAFTLGPPQLASVRQERKKRTSALDARLVFGSVNVVRSVLRGPSRCGPRSADYYLPGVSATRGCFGYLVKIAATALSMACCGLSSDLLVTRPFAEPDQISSLCC